MTILQLLEKRKKELLDEIAAGYKQLGYSLSETEKTRIKREIDSLHEKLNEIDSQLTLSPENTNRRELDLKSKMLKIDFKKAVEIIESFVKHNKQEENAILFLIQNTVNTAGEKCVARLRNILEDNTGHFSPFEIRCSINTTNIKALLDQLARHFGVQQDSTDLVSYAEIIVGKICDRVQKSGSIVFIELHSWDYLQPKEDVLPWFLSNFWFPLLQQSANRLEEYRRVRFVVVITTKGDILTTHPSLNNHCINSWSCFNKFKIFELILEHHWTQQEIEDWLEKFSGYKAAQILTLAEEIYSSTRGNPTLICSELLEALNT